MRRGVLVIAAAALFASSCSRDHFEPGVIKSVNDQQICVSFGARAVQCIDVSSQFVRGGWDQQMAVGACVSLELEGGSSRIKSIELVECPKDR